MILFRFRRFLRYYGLDWHLKILFEYNVPPLIIRVKTYTLRKKLLLSYQKEKITIFSSNIAKKAKIGFFFPFSMAFWHLKILSKWAKNGLVCLLRPGTTFSNYYMSSFQNNFFRSTLMGIGRGGKGFPKQEFDQLKNKWSPVKLG